MDRCQAEMGRGREKRRVEESRSEKRKSQKKEDADARKGRKVAKHWFFQWFVAPEGRKVGSLKRRVRSQLARWEVKNCTPLWREAHLQVIKMYKIHQLRTTFGSWDVEKEHPLWREAYFEVKMYKTHHVRTTFGSCDVEKVHAVVARSAFRSQNVQSTPCTEHFWTFRCGRRKGLCTLSTVSKTWGFCSISKSDGRRGTFEEDLQRCISRGRCSTKDMFIRDVRRSGRWFPDGVAFWSIRSSGLLRWFCVTGAALRMTWHHFFVAGAVLSTGGLEKSQNALVRSC